MRARSIERYFAMEKEKAWPSLKVMTAVLNIANAASTFQRAMTLSQLVFVDDTKFAIARSEVFSDADARLAAMEYAEIAEVHSGRDQHASVIAVTAAMRAAQDGVLGAARELTYDRGQVALAAALGEARGRAFGVISAAWEAFESVLDACAGGSDYAAAVKEDFDGPAGNGALAAALAADLGGAPECYAGVLDEAFGRGREDGERAMRERGSRLA